MSVPKFKMKPGKDPEMLEMLMAEISERYGEKDHHSVRVAYIAELSLTIHQYLKKGCARKLMRIFKDSMRV